MDEETRDGLRYALVVLVVASGLTTWVGIAAAFHGVVIRGGDEPTFNPGTGGPNDVIVSDSRPIVYQGESDIDFERSNGDPVGPGQLVGTTGDAEGPMEGFVFGIGRDGVVGDGQLPNQDRATIGGLENYVKTLSAQALTQRQLTERILSQTTRDTASDDLLVRESFRYAEASTRITSVVPAEFAGQEGVTRIEVGETMVVKGETNRQPDRTSITVAVVEGPSAGQFDVASTDQWGANGTWTVRFDTEGVEPGTYTVEADDGATTDRVEVQLVPEGERGPLDSSGNETNASGLPRLPPGRAR